jgi:hypothetical protein
MPAFKVRTYEESREVIAEKLEFCPDGVRLYSEGRVVAAFSRYLWIEELKPEPEVEVPVVPVIEEPVTPESPEPVSE